MFLQSSNNKKNFPYEFYKERTVITPDQEDFDFVKPKIGKLYTFTYRNPNKDEDINLSEPIEENCIQFLTTRNNHDCIDTQSELIYLEDTVTIVENEPFLIIDYMVCLISNGYAFEDLKTNPKYSLIVKVLYENDILYRAFLVTSKYNEFSCRIKELIDNG